jgi:hypothetical protein
MFEQNFLRKHYSFLVVNNIIINNFFTINNLFAVSEVDINIMKKKKTENTKDNYFYIFLMIFISR